MGKTYKISIEDLLTRNNNLVSNEIEFVKSFKHLGELEYKILDYCFFYIPIYNSVMKKLIIQPLKLLDYLGLEYTEEDLKLVARAFKSINENTVLYIPIKEDGKYGMKMAKVFDYIDFFENSVVQLEFSNYTTSYICNLKKNYPSFLISELASIRSKYSFKLLKLWQLFPKNAKLTIIEGSLYEWQEWFLEDGCCLSAGEFMQNILKRAVTELESKFDFSIKLKTHREGRLVVGYRMEITDRRTGLLQKTNPIDNNNREECSEIQTTIYDFLYENT